MPNSKRARMFGVFGCDTFPSATAAMHAATAWGIDAHDSGQALNGLVVLIARNEQGIHAMLTRRSLARESYAKTAPELVARLDQQHDRDALLFLVGCEDSAEPATVFSARELKEALYAQQ